MSADGPGPVLWVDFGGVLTDSVAGAVSRVEAESGLPWPVLESAASTVARRRGLRGWEPLELGVLSQSQWGSELAAALPPGSVSRFDLRRWDDVWYRDRRVEHELVAELLRWRAQGMRIGLLTNSVAEWEPHRHRLLGGTDLFDAVVRSHEVALAKPDPRIFRHADAVLAPRGTASWLVDDTPANCVAAEQHGWVDLWHTSARSTVSVLRALRLGRSPATSAHTEWGT